MVFHYPPLPSNDGLRTLTLQPGDFWEPLTGKLESVAFAMKPKYIALSYTWADPDPKYASIPAMPRPSMENGGSFAKPGNIVETPFITINGESLRLFHNLALALRFLRSPTHPLPLWVDAVCIDQSNVDERNAQVALMAFIFKRAAGVLSWLGTPNLDSGFGHFNDTEKDLKSLWLGGLSCKIAHRFAENTVGTQLFSFTNGPIPPWASREPLYPLPLLRKLAAGDRIPRVQDNPYWSRLWVIQEVCLPGNLAFVFGGEVWSEALMRQMLVAADRIPGRIVDTRQQAQMTMEKLLAARKERFTDAMRLELLIERFMHSGCGEMRDRVFGLVGLANDVDSIAMNTTRPQVDWTQGLGRGRGRGLLEIDYTRGFYDIWRDVVSYMYFRAKPLLDFGKEDEEKEDERRIRVVRFAGVVQSAFEGKVEEAASSVATQGPSPAMHQSATSPQAPMCPPQRQMIQAKGYIAGRVVHIGPTYRDFVGSYHEQERWVASWDTHYHAAHDLEKLREMEEAYSTKIINYSETDLARIRHINNNSARAWEILDSAPPAELRRSLPHHDEDSEPVRFLGSEFCMGLAPAGVKLGDLVVRFWNCDAAVVLRTAIGDYPYRTCELVGRADVAEPHGQRIAGMDNTAKDAIRSAKAMYVRLDFETLQLISAGITL